MALIAVAARPPGQQISEYVVVATEMLNGVGEARKAERPALDFTYDMPLERGLECERSRNNEEVVVVDKDVCALLTKQDVVHPLEGLINLENAV